MGPVASMTCSPSTAHNLQGDAPKGMTSLVAWKNILAISAGFLAFLVIAFGFARAVKLLCHWAAVPVDIPSRWPLSVFELKIPGIGDSSLGWCLSAAILLLFFCLLRWIPGRIATSLPAVLLLGFVLVVSTNLIHGPWYGLIHPHEGPLQYYHDAVQVRSAGEFLRDFEAVQPSLSCHSRTHPPGAVLFYYGLLRILGSPAAISIAIAALAVGLSATFLHRLLSHEFNRETAGYVTLLFLLIPAVQIYYCAALDAVLAGWCLGALLFAREPNPWVSIVGGIACLFCASFLSFGACFLLPVLLGFEVITRRSIWRFSAVILGVGVLYAAIDLGWGFNYLASFQAASASVNQGSFYLFSEPVSYLMMLLEDIAEILVFLGPFLLLLFVFGVRVMLRTRTYADLLVLSCLGIFTLLAMFLTGAFRTGETARACLFIYPYLLLPVAVYLHRTGDPSQQRSRLLSVVFVQSVAMQTLGGYFW